MLMTYKESSHYLLPGINIYLSFYSPTYNIGYSAKNYMQNSKRKQSTVKRQSNQQIQTQLIQLLELSNREFKITMIS